MENVVASRAREAADLDRDVEEMAQGQLIRVMADARYCWRQAAFRAEKRESESIAEKMAEGFNVTTARSLAMRDEGMAALREEAIRWEHRYLVAYHRFRMLSTMPTEPDPTES